MTMMKVTVRDLWDRLLMEKISLKMMVWFFLINTGVF